MYRIPLDDSRAQRKINLLQSLSAGFSISRVAKRNVPASDLVRDTGYVYYQSRETWDYDADGYIGGVIPSLSDYRYSWDWEKFPDRAYSGLRMKRGRSGETVIEGEVASRYSQDSLIPRYVHIRGSLPYTVGEIRRIYEENLGEEIEAIDEEIYWTLEARVEEIKEEIIAMQDSCTHRIIEFDSEFRGGYCEDCQREFDDFEMEDVRHRIVGKQ